MQDRRTAAGSTLWLLMLLGVAIASTPTHAQSTIDADAHDAYLWLNAPTKLSPLPNFTADAPDAPLTVAPAPIRAGSGEITWKWAMQRVPSTYHVPQETTFQLELAFTGLDRVVPAVHPEHLDDAGQLTIQADVLRLSSDNAIATASTTLDPAVLTDEAIHTITLTATTHTTTTYGTTPGDAPLFGLKVTLHGVAQNQQPPLILTGDDGHPARLHAPGFPISALRTWDQRETADQTCNERILQGMPCDEEHPPTEERAPATSDDVVAAEAPGAGTLPWLTLAAFVALLTRTRRS